MDETRSTPWWHPGAPGAPVNDGFDRRADPGSTSTETSPHETAPAETEQPSAAPADTETSRTAAPAEPYDPWGVTAPIPGYRPPPPPPPQAGADTGGPGRGRRFARTAGGLALLLAIATAGGFIGAAIDDDSAPVTAPAANSVNRDSSAVQPTNSVAQGSIEAAAKTISSSVVTIEVRREGSGPFGRGGGGGTGSGVVVREDGYILTNNHVVEAAANGSSISVTLADGTSADATIVGRDPSSDLAVLKVTGKTGLKAATFADSDKLSIGQQVVAVGAPLGLSGTVTSGIVSSVQRPVRTGGEGVDQQSAVIDAVQTDAAINPGNSGGPLVDQAGRVVGINSAIASVNQGGSGQSGNIGVGFAIPANDAADVADQIIAKGYAEHAVVGVSAGDSDDGAQIRDVTQGGPAAGAGLQPGDIVTKVGDRQVFDVDSLIAAVRDHNPGEKVTITYVRDGDTRTATITMGSRRG